MIKTANFFNVGLYSPVEAARYMRVPGRRLRRWVFGTQKAQPVISPELGDFNGKQVVTFQDFVQALSVHDIRLNIGIPLTKIREAYKRAQQIYGIENPFAIEHGIFVFGDRSKPEKCELGVYLHSQEKNVAEIAERNCVQLTGKNKDNQLIHEIVQHFSRRIKYETKAVSYEAFSKFGHRILMEPDFRFGQPYLEDFGYEAATLADAARIEGSVRRAADLYEVPLTAVKASIAYLKDLEKPPEHIQPRKIKAT